MLSDSCISGHRYVCGMPISGLSDNGKSFKAVAVFLGRVFKDLTVIDYFFTLETEWLFYVEKVGWCLRLVKRCLRKFISQAKLMNCTQLWWKWSPLLIQDHFRQIWRSSFPFYHWKTCCQFISATRLDHHYHDKVEGLDI